MDKKELELYKKMVKDKHKHDWVWKVLAIVFMITTVVFAILYFASGEVVKTTTNDVEIVNEGSGNTNTVNINS